MKECDSCGDEVPDAAAREYDDGFIECQQCFTLAVENDLSGYRKRSSW